MRGVVVVAVAACGGAGDAAPDATPVDAPVSASCMAAATYSDLARIEAEIFRPSCALAGCHNGEDTSPGRVDLRPDMARATLARMSRIDPTRTLVVPGEPTRSYLLLMIQQITPELLVPPASPPPSEIGFMPQGTAGEPLCAEKRAAIERWIASDLSPRTSH